MCLFYLSSLSLWNQVVHKYAFEWWAAVVTCMAAFFGLHFLLLIGCPADGDAIDFLEFVCALNNTQHLILSTFTQSLHMNGCTVLVLESRNLKGLDIPHWRSTFTKLFSKSLVKICHTLWSFSRIWHVLRGVDNLGSMATYSWVWSRCLGRHSMSAKCFQATQLDGWTPLINLSLWWSYLVRIVSTFKYLHLCCEGVGFCHYGSCYLELSLLGLCGHVTAITCIIDITCKFVHNIAVLGYY